jgi:hypothetical protein
MEETRQPSKLEADRRRHLHALTFVRFFKRLKLDYPQPETTRASRRFVKAMKKLDVSLLGSSPTEPQADPCRKSFPITISSAATFLTCSRRYLCMIRMTVSLQSKHCSIRGSRKRRHQMMALRLLRFDYRDRSKPKEQPQGIMGIVTEGDGLICEI